MLGGEAGERQLTKPGCEMDPDDARVADIGAGSDAGLGRVAKPLVEERADRHSLSGEWHPACLRAEGCLELVTDLASGPPEERPPCPSSVGSREPDFIVVSRRSDGTLGASIVDPHGDYLADARAKLQALAEFAEQFGDRFVRIESVAKVDDGSLRVLDLGDPIVRADVLAFQGGKVTTLYQSGHSRPYP